MTKRAPAKQTKRTDSPAQYARTRPPRNWRKVFLRELAIDGNRTRAAEAARVSHGTVYEHRNADPDFRAEWDAAIDLAGEHLEAEAWRRAVSGTDKPMVSMGAVVRNPDGSPLMERVYSDTLMALLLRGARPQKYRENLNVTGQVDSVGVSVVLEAIQHDPNYAERANELIRLFAPRGEASTRAE